MMGQAEAEVRGPSDKEVVAHLQRLASARAHLLHAEKIGAEAAAAHRRDQVRNKEIEEAHASVIWAQAQLLTATRGGRAERALQQAQDLERQALRRHGYSSFASYLEHRTAIPPADIALELACREHDAALAEWEALAADAIGAGADDRFAEPDAPRIPEARIVRDEATSTVVIDLTGDNPRRIA
jgi:hypothetical protein